MDFRSHISLFGAFILVVFDVFFSLLKFGGKAEVTYFVYVFSILFKDQYVLQFDVTVGYSFSVKVV